MDVGVIEFEAEEILEPPNDESGEDEGILEETTESVGVGVFEFEIVGVDDGEGGVAPPEQTHSSSPLIPVPNQTLPEAEVHVDGLIHVPFKEIIVG